MAASKSTTEQLPITTQEDSSTETPMGSDVEELLAALANASKVQTAQASQIMRLKILVADLSARMYTIETNAGLRQSGSLTIDGLRFAGMSSRATYKSVVERVLLEFDQAQ